MCNRREYIPPFEWRPAIAGMMLPFLLLAILAGCQKNPLTIYRPNARTQLEERAFNVLLVSERMITTAEASNAAGTLPEFMRPIVDALIVAHNLARTAAANYVAVIGAADEQERAAALVALLEDVDSEITKMFQRGAQ